MVPNPIYDGDGDGPVYDSVRPQYETLVAVAPSVTAARAQQQASTVTGTSHNNDPDVVRYVDPPIQLPQFRSQSFTHTLTDIDRGSASRSYSVSLPPPRYFYNNNIGKVWLYYLMEPIQTLQCRSTSSKVATFINLIVNNTGKGYLYRT